MAARKGGRKVVAQEAVPPADEAPEERAQKRGLRRTAKLHERPTPMNLRQAAKQNYQDVGKKDEGDPDDPLSKAGMRRVKQRDDDRVRSLRESRIRSEIESAGGDPDQKTPNVFVSVARDKQAAIAEQKRIDAANKKPGLNRYRATPAKPGDDDYKEEPRRPTAEEGPQPWMAVPRGPNAPRAIPQETQEIPDHIRYEGFDDITPSGQPIIRGKPQVFVEADRSWDGYNERPTKDIKGFNPNLFEDLSDEEPEIIRSTPESARLEQIKRLKPVKYIPDPLPPDPDDPVWNEIRRKANARLKG